jgi:hypothetical protein
VVDGHPGLTPSRQCAADLARIETQDVTDPFERQQPFLLRRLNPRCCLCKQHFAPRIAGEHMALVALDHILQHCQHQAPLRQRAVIARNGRKVLVRQHSHGLEQD